MKRTNLRRAVSGVLSFAITATTILGDFTVPTNVFASEDTSVSSESSLEDYSEGSGSITSEYIAANLDGDLGSEAAALNADAAYAVAEEYLLSEAASSGNDVESVTVSEDITESEEGIEFEDGTGVEDSESTDIETVTDAATDDANVIIMETAETVSASGNDAEPAGVSSNDAGIATLSLDDTVTSDVETADAETVETEAVETEQAETETVEMEETETEVTVSEEEIAALAEEILDSTADIETVDDYDTNGLATVYHYILLNCTLVDADDNGYVVFYDNSTTTLTTITNDTTKELIKKTYIVTTEKVMGATLTIYEQNDDGTKGKIVDTWETDGYQVTE